MDGHTDSLSLFYTPTNDTSVRSVEWVEYRPIGQLSSDGALEFNISGNSHKYVDLANTRLKIKFRIVQGDGQVLPMLKGTDDPNRPKANVGPVNLFLQSLWRQVDVFLQQQAISPNVSTKYPYKAYIDALLHYDMNAKETQLQSQLYYKDNELTNGSDNDPLDGSNMGLYKRTEMTSQSTIVDMEGPVYHDICMQSCYILNGVQVGFKFWPSSNQFKLMSLSKSDGFKVEIKEAVLKVCLIEVAPEVVIAHSETLQYGAAKYFYERTDMKSFAIAKGQYSCCVEDIYQGEVPNRVVVGFVSSEAFMGSYEKNPFNFQTFALSFAGFYIDGRSMPSEPLTPNYKAGNYLSAYMTTFEENYQKNFGHYITRDDYIRGNCLYVFDLCQNHCEKIALNVKRGHTRLEVKFAEALPEAVTMVVMAKFPGMMEIDKTRTVKTMSPSEM